MSAAELIPDAIAGDRYYCGVLRDREWRAVANCQHNHRSREAAERCATALRLDAIRRQYGPVR